MRNTLMQDIVTAMKAKDKLTLATLRMVKGSMQLEEISKKHELSDDEMISIFVKEIKTRNESIREFALGNRQDLVDSTKKEIEILAKYMPKQLSTDEIDSEIEKAFQEVNPESMRDMGKLMTILTPIFKGKADMGLVSKKIKEKIAN
jgi:uncharacterized protein YqeY